MNPRRLEAFYRERSDRGEPLVLATVTETRGSTYSKAGAHMLIGRDGIFQGMLSGGCLEGDLAIRAAAVLESGIPQSVTYDLSDENDDLWGLGVGCDGLLRVFLQPLDARDGYEPYASVASLQNGREPFAVATMLEDKAGLPAGAGVIVVGNETRPFGLASAELEALSRVAATARDKGSSGVESATLGEDSVDVMIALLRPVPRLLILGAGLDAEPVLRFGNELGWVCTVADHRPGYLERGGFESAEQTVCAPAAELAATLDLDDYDLAIVMSHHLVSDQAYLEALADSAVGYVGLLGPIARRERLVGAIGAAAERLEGRLHGPAGLDIGGRGPGAIALSIVAAMQMQLAGKT
ncbi:MAG: XdhC family protein [Woeseiaceae bacterium]|nr:XdhC family protein [Woeseiaceae bacterium]